MRLETDFTGRTLNEVAAERARQTNKWGEQNHEAAQWLAILTEEVGEVARAVCDASINPGQTKAYREEQWENYREELVQVAAVAVAMIESYDRNFDARSLKD